MTLLRSTVAAASLLAALRPLSAQAPAAATPAAPAAPVAAARVPAPVLQTVGFDIAAAVDQRWRLSLEALVFGRWSVGLSGTYTTHPTGSGYAYYAYGGTDPIYPCTINSCLPYPNVDYRAWSFDLSARYYPAVLSLGNARQRVSVFVGEYISYGQREITTDEFAYCPVCAQPVDTLVQPPYNPLPQVFPGITTKLEAFEPGVELGLRLMPARNVFLDVGGNFRLVRMDDPWSVKRPGDIDPKLVVAFGIGW